MMNTLKMIAMMTKIRFIKTLFICAVLLCVMMPAHAFAADGLDDIPLIKEEIVYALMDCEGNVDKVIAVNYLSAESPGTFRDYGEYADITALRGEEPQRRSAIATDGVLANGETIYQGTLDSAELPWVFDIRFALDGEAIEPRLLAGQSGRLSIRVSVTANGDCPAYRTYFDRYALQMTLAMPRDKCVVIKTRGAMAANAGDSKVITATALPSAGLYASIEADVTDFTMDGILFSAARASIPMPKLDASTLTDRLDDVSSAIGEMSYAAARLSTAADMLRDGLNTMGGMNGMNGMGGMSGGYAASSVVSAIKTKAVSLVSGSLATGLASLSEGMAMLSEQTAAMPEAAAAEVSGMLAAYANNDGGTEVPSFVDSRNGMIKSVQFMMKTAPIAPYNRH